MKKIKALQLFSEEYLKSIRHLTPEQIVKFLDDFRQLHGGGTLHLSQSTDSEDSTA